VRVESRNRFAARGTNEDMIDVLVVAKDQSPTSRSSRNFVEAKRSRRAKLHLQDRRLDPSGRSIASVGRTPDC
jgi:hypothetical protein